MQIDLINGKRSSHFFGTSKYSHEISKRIQSVEFNFIEYPGHQYPLLDGFIKRFIYPSIVKRQIHENGLKHITSQYLAFLQNDFKWKNCVITCHDLIPWIQEGNRSRFWKKNINGLQNASEIIAVSNFTKNEIAHSLKIPMDLIQVIHCGVDRNHYHPADKDATRELLEIGKDLNVVLYVGSEEPRKNFPLLLEAFDEVRKNIPNLVLIKVGTAQAPGMRKKSYNLVTKLHLQNSVFFTGYISESDLPMYYQAADLFVFPSSYEGFGIPPLEAMACGCPVIATNATSLPEVVGDAGILFTPDDKTQIVENMTKILENPAYARFLSEKGVIRSKMFSWENSAAKMEKVYQIHET